MKILRNLSVPTGNILIVEGERGNLECLSLGDYGKQVNLNQHKPVTHTDLLPLTEKWVCTISTQYGCSMGCSFCDVPKVGPGKNATLDDLTGQVVTVLQLHPEVKSTKRLNVHFARMGEPTWNLAVLDCADWLSRFHDPANGCIVHPVVSTMMPLHNHALPTFIQEWMKIKNVTFGGDAGLQLSINTTDECLRYEMFNGNAHTLSEIAHIMDGIVPIGRKITLNFAVADWPINANALLDFFDPANYIVKLTPMHKTTTAIEHGIETEGDYTTHYPYLQHEEALKAAGYDVLTFIASREEDLGRITCGNAILSGTVPLVPYEE